MSNQEEMPWPREGADAFAAGDNVLTNCDLQWLDMLCADKDALIAEGFKDAADRTVEALERPEEARHADPYLFPVAYLYRHYVELSLKSLYRDASRLLDRKPDPKVTKKHDLHELWNKTKGALSACFPQEDPSALRNVEEVILQFHKLDSSGQSFRYARDTSGKPHLKNAPRSIDLANLKNIMQGIGNFLDACDAAVGAALGDKDEDPHDMTHG